MVSTRSSCLHAGGQEGLDAIHGSISTTFPVGVVLRKATWPSQVRELPRVRNIPKAPPVLTWGRPLPSAVVAPSQLWSLTTELQPTPRVTVRPRRDPIRCRDLVCCPH